MPRWSEQAAKRLRDGETIEETVPFGENGVVVTNQRLLAFMPDSEGANFRAVERPNVEGAKLRNIGNPDWIEYIIKGGIAAVVGIFVGYTMDFGGMISLNVIEPEAARRTGVGSLMGMLSDISILLEKLDDMLLVIGLLGVAVWLGGIGMYIESREHVLRIRIAGATNLRVPAPKDTEDECRRLQRCLRTDADEPDEADSSYDESVSARPEEQHSYPDTT